MPNIGSGASVAPAVPLDRIARTGHAVRKRTRNGTILTCPGADNTVRWHPGERFHDLFDRRFDELGEEAVALEFPSVAFSFADLSRLSNQISHQLLAEGVLPGDRIGLLFDRTVWAYATMLAVSKVGAAWVPLDKAFPPERATYIAQDAQVSLILSTRALASVLEEVSCRVLWIEELREELTCRPNIAPPRAPRIPDTLAYIIYTSGSTGKPKGVAVNHSGICNFLCVAAQTYGLLAGARVYQGMTIAFDFSFEEIWVPFLVGATLVPAPPGGALLGQDLADFLRERRITALCCVPTLLATLDETTLPHLDFILVSGEACPGQLIERWHRPDRVFLNVYGPTEASVTCTWARPTPGCDSTIGRPLPTYTIAILDETGHRALPQGKIGEIAVAGIGVAEGYVNNPDKTKAAFVPDFLRIGNNPGKRLYRTGDLGRITPTGEIEYLGRNDTQVKVRGYRIELSEIESVLMTMPGIAQAVVEAWEPQPGVKELVAYCTAKPGAARPDLEGLNAMLREALPAYMVPASYELLDAMPMLPSDKVDRKALPRPSGARKVDRQTAYVAPQTPEEIVMVEVLADMLRVEKISVDDHLINDLGANSLVLAQFCSALTRKNANLRLPIRDVYLNPTIRALAGALSGPDQRVAIAPPDREADPHIASNLKYWLTGVAQAVTILGFAVLAAVIFIEALLWIAQASTLAASHGRGFLLASILFVVAVILPVAMKWTLVGRMGETRFPAWSYAYYRFWLVRSAIGASPLALTQGTPVFNFYLRLLGARIGRDAMVGCAVPAVPDLLDVGEGAVIRAASHASCYRATGGAIETGPIRVGRNAYVGSASILEPGSEIGEEAELAHASCLPRGHRIPPGASYHGSPAEPAPGKISPLPPARPAAWRAVGFTIAQILWMLELGTLALVVPESVFSWVFFDLAAPEPLAFAMIGMFGPAILLAAALVPVFLCGSAILVFVVPRLARLALQPGKIYPRYGLHHYLWFPLVRMSNSGFFNSLLGDSVFIVPYLKAVGYKLDPVKQTGSNFGLAQAHDVPDLCSVGTGTLVSDGLWMENADYTAGTFRLGPVEIGKGSFIGSNVVFPTGARVGDNCLLATKVMLPRDGKVYHDCGLLGSPPFEIPRSVLRDKQLNKYRDPAILQQRLKMKTRDNFVSILVLLCLRFLVGLGLLVLGVGGIVLYLRHGGPVLIGTALASILLLIGTDILIERMAIFFRQLKPLNCSIYDAEFWQQERFWKYSLTPLMPSMMLLHGTPFSAVVLRALGVKVGARLFDDGCWIVEKTMTKIGDDCTLAGRSVIQGHSLEDAAFKSDRISIGDRCTIGESSWIHLGTRIEDDVRIAADSFVMKGNIAQQGSIWRGNPASCVA